jgi:hypothetical protein
MPRQGLIQMVAAQLVRAAAVGAIRLQFAAI